VKHVGFGALILAVLVLEFLATPAHRQTREFLTRETILSDSVDLTDPSYTEEFLPAYDHAPEVHAASLVETSGGDVLAVWYGGSEEGAKDVALYGAVLGRTAREWRKTGILASRSQTAADLGRYIKKLGNPVMLRDAKGRLWLFYVSVSIGGWSGSSINYRTSDDSGSTWNPAQRLVTSPFLNISTLVKGTPFLYRGGSIGLPVYHEFIGKFGELLVLDNTGSVLDKVRLTYGRHSLQPVICPLDSERAAAFLRYAGPPPGRILATWTRDGGESWDAAIKVDLPNPNAAITGLRYGEGRIFLVYNHLERDRYNLSLAVSEDEGRTWRRVYAFEDNPSPPLGKRRSEFSYPYMIRTHSGRFHLVYTWQKTRIKHVSFNAAWLEGVAGRNGETGSVELLETRRPIRDG